MQQEHNIQVGIVQLLDEADADPGWMDLANRDALVPWVPKKNVDAVRLWAKHFSPMGHDSGIYISHEWADFFTKMLLSPLHFEWARSCRLGKIWD